MWLSRHPIYEGIISSKQILARIKVNEFACFCFRRKARQERVCAALNHVCEYTRSLDIEE